MLICRWQRFRRRFYCSIMTESVSLLANFAPELTWTRYPFIAWFRSCFTLSISRNVSSLTYSSTKSRRQVASPESGRFWWQYGDGCPIPIRLGGLEVRRELAQRRPGWKRILAYFVGHRTLLFAPICRCFGFVKQCFIFMTHFQGGKA